MLGVLISLFLLPALSGYGKGCKSNSRSSSVFGRFRWCVCWYDAPEMLIATKVFSGVSSYLL
jgi:hypothetical protein